MKDLLNLDGMVGQVEDIKEHIYSYSAILSQIIFAHRIRRGMTQQDLADAANVGLKTIYRAEGGSGNITNDKYEQIFFALGIDLKDFGRIFDEAVAKYQNGLE